MYATMGYIVPEYFKFPGYLSPSLGLKFSDVPNGLAALSKLFGKQTLLKVSSICQQMQQPWTAAQICILNLLCEALRLP